MIRQLMFAALAAALLLSAGCTKDEPSRPVLPPAEQPQQTRSVRFAFTADQPITVSSTRAMDENAVGDIHLFLFGPKSYYFLIPEGESTFVANDIIHGEYEIYATANCTGINSGMNAAELDNALAVADPSADRMAMSFRGNVTIGKGSSFVPIALRRTFAKLTYRVTIDQSMDDWMWFESAWIINVPEQVSVFDNPDLTSAVSYTRHSLKQQIHAHYFEGEVFIPENKRGTNPGARNYYNAPANATYLQINIGSVFPHQINQYIVYLGSDNESDYNVRRNTNYVYDITIWAKNGEMGLNYDYYGIEMNYDYTPGSLAVGERPMPIAIARSSRPNLYTVNVTAHAYSGDINYLTIDGKRANADGIIDLGTFDLSSTTFEFFRDKTFSYNPPLITPGNSLLQIWWTFTDQYGDDIYFITDHRYYNSVEVYFFWPGQPEGVIGAWGMANHISMHPRVDDQENMTELYCLDDYIEIEASSPYPFVGYYSDPERTQLITTEKKVKVYPTQAIMPYYPLFVPPETE